MQRARVDTVPVSVLVLLVLLVLVLVMRMPGVDARIYVGVVELQRRALEPEAIVSVSIRAGVPYRATRGHAHRERQRRRLHTRADTDTGLDRLFAQHEHRVALRASPRARTRDHTRARQRAAHMRGRRLMHRREGHIRLRLQRMGGVQGHLRRRV